jgi:hypothetical protein
MFTFSIAIQQASEDKVELLKELYALFDES